MAHVETVACLCTEHPGPPPSDGHQTEPDHQAPETVSSSSHHDDPDRTEVPRVTYVPYESELQMPDIMRLMKADLSEPYSIYTYRYFIHNWPRLCILAQCDDRYVGAIVCKLEPHHYNTRRGYIAMLAVDKDYRKRKIGQELVQTPDIVRKGLGFRLVWNWDILPSAESAVVQLNTKLLVGLDYLTILQK